MELSAFMAWTGSPLYPGHKLLVTLVIHYVVNYYFGVFYLSLVISLPVHVSEANHKRINILVHNVGNRIQCQGSK
jgi:hypothetical protein